MTGSRRLCVGCCVDFLFQCIVVDLQKKIEGREGKVVVDLKKKIGLIQACLNIDFKCISFL